MTPMKCKCGEKARIRNKGKVYWVECRNKCGIRTGYYTSVYDNLIAEERAVSEWNRMVQFCNTNR